jgi:hypothetical protein
MLSVTRINPARPHRARPVVVMTELAWRRISAGDGGAPAMPDVSPQTDGAG